MDFSESGLPQHSALIKRAFEIGVEFEQKAGSDPGEAPFNMSYVISAALSMIQTHPLAEDDTIAALLVWPFYEVTHTKADIEAALGISVANMLEKINDTNLGNTKTLLNFKAEEQRLLLGALYVISQSYTQASVYDPQQMNFRKFIEWDYKSELAILRNAQPLFFRVVKEQLDLAITNIIRLERMRPDAPPPGPSPI